MLLRVLGCLRPSTISLSSSVCQCICLASGYFPWLESTSARFQDTKQRRLSRPQERDIQCCKTVRTYAQALFRPPFSLAIVPDGPLPIHLSGKLSQGFRVSPLVRVLHRR